MYIYIYIYITSCPSIYCKSLYKVIILMTYYIQVLYRRFLRIGAVASCSKKKISKGNVLVHCFVIKSLYTDFSELVPSPVAVQVPGRNSEESV